MKRELLISSVDSLRLWCILTVVLGAVSCRERIEIANKTVEIRHQPDAPNQLVSIEISNPFSETVQVKEFRTTCSCSTPQFNSVNIAPQKAAKVEIALDTTRIAQTMPDGGIIRLTPRLQSLSSNRVVDGRSIEIRFVADRILSAHTSIIYVSESGDNNLEMTSTMECVVEPKTSVPWLRCTNVTGEDLSKHHVLRFRLDKIPDDFISEDLRIDVDCYDREGRKRDTFYLLAAPVRKNWFSCDRTVFHVDRSFDVEIKLVCTLGNTIRNVRLDPTNSYNNEISVDWNSENGSIHITGTLNAKMSTTAEIRLLVEGGESRTSFFDVFLCVNAP